jgi:hypothetical protein
MVIAFESLAGGFAPLNIQEKQKAGKRGGAEVASAISRSAEKLGILS